MPFLLNKENIRGLLMLVASLTFASFSGCTTEKHYPAPAPTVIHESGPSPSDAREGARQGAREGARQGAREGVRDQTRP